MDFQITVRHTPRVFRLAVFRFWLRFCGRDFAIAIVLSTVSVFGMTVLGWTQAYIAVIAGVALCFILGMTTLLIVQLSRARTRLREMQDLRVEWEFDEDGIVRRSERGESSFAWPSVRKLWRFPDVWLIFLGEEEYSTLPRDAMTPLVEAFLSRKVEAAGGKVR